VVPDLHHDQRITAFGLFAEAYTGLVARFSGQLAEHGLSLVEFEVLIRLARSRDHRLRMTELAGQVALTTSGITRVVDRLERDKLVRRQACPSDRRGSWAVLTGAGLSRLATALPGHLALVEQHFTGRFRSDELELMVTRLRDIRDEVHPAARPRPADAPPDQRPDPAPVAARSTGRRPAGAVDRQRAARQGERSASPRTPPRRSTPALARANTGTTR
jgi:DNA-binding MarR family transcriptional regulator